MTSGSPKGAATTLLIRKATRADSAAVLDLAREARLLEAGIGESIEDFDVAEQQGRIIGSAGLERHGDDALLRTVVVAPARRGEGIGQLLVEAGMRRARVLELRAVYLLTTTAREFFDGVGFEVMTRDSAPPGIRESWEFKIGCPGTAVLMCRHI